MAASIYYSPMSSSPKLKFYTCSEGQNPVISGAWPMTQRRVHSRQGSLAETSTTVSRKLIKTLPLKSGTIPKCRQRPMSMPSHHFQVHADALAALQAYSLDSDEDQIIQLPLNSIQNEISDPVNHSSQSNKLSPSTPTPTCVPWIPNVRVIKKLQSKIGIGGVEDIESDQNFPPPRFHSVHGENIQIFQNGSAVKRISSQSYCKAIVFSDRTIKINEKICVKVIGSTSEFAGGIRFGFTNQDPTTLRHRLPDYAIPDLARKGYWIKAFHQYNLLRNDAILFYYVNHSGKVRYGINGKKMGTFLKYVDTRRPLWAILDVYGNTTAIELVDPKAHLNNSRRSIEEENNVHKEDIDSALGSSFKSLTLRSESSGIKSVNKSSSQKIPRFNNLQFHSTCGRNVQLNKCQNVAWRNSLETGNAYVFSSRPLHNGETVVIQVEQSEVKLGCSVGSMAFGFTSANPETINIKSLPDDSYYLVDRSEYWIFKKDVLSNLLSGDELAFTLTQSGAVTMRRNLEAPIIIMYVDNSTPLYQFFDLYGSTFKIALVGSTLPKRIHPEPISQAIAQKLQIPIVIPSSPSRRHALTSPIPSSPSRMNHNTSSSPIPEIFKYNSISQSQYGHQEDLAQNSNSPTKLVGTGNQFRPLPKLPIPKDGDIIELKSNPRHHMSYTGVGNDDIEVKVGISSKRDFSLIKKEEPLVSTSEKKNWAVDCVACSLRPVNCLFSPCGHLTLCFECATEYWNYSRIQDSCACPICGLRILEIIQTSKSS